MVYTYAGIFNDKDKFLVIYVQYFLNIFVNMYPFFTRYIHIICLLQSVVVIHTVWGVTRAVVTVVVVYNVIMWLEFAQTDVLQECLEINVI